MKITIKLTKEEKKLWNKWKPVARLGSDWGFVGDWLDVNGVYWGDDDGFVFGVEFVKELKKQIDKISKEVKE